MANYLRKLKGKFSRSHSRSQPSIHQSGPNATITIQGSYNDVGRDQNITYITNLGGTLWIIQSKQNLTRQWLEQNMTRYVYFHSWSKLSDIYSDYLESSYKEPPQGGECCVELIYQPSTSHLLWRHTNCGFDIHIFMAWKLRILNIRAGRFSWYREINDREDGCARST